MGGKLLLVFLGSLGITDYDFISGRISEIDENEMDENGQAHAKGVRAGWQIIKIDGKKYTKELFMSHLKGVENYELIFLTNVTFLPQFCKNFNKYRDHFNMTSSWLGGWTNIHVNYNCPIEIINLGSEETIENSFLKKVEETMRHCSGNGCERYRGCFSRGRYKFSRMTRFNCDTFASVSYFHSTSDVTGTCDDTRAYFLKKKKKFLLLFLFYFLFF